MAILLKRVTKRRENACAWIEVVLAYFLDQVTILVQASPEAPSGGEDITLDVGRWRLWWKPDANPEMPVRMVGILSVV